MFDDIKILKISGDGGACFFCAGVAKNIVGTDYDVCDEKDCIEYAIEKKQEDLIDAMRSMPQTKSDERYSFLHGK